MRFWFLVVLMFPVLMFSVFVEAYTVNVKNLKVRSSNVVIEFDGPVNEFLCNEIIIGTQTYFLSTSLDSDIYDVLLHALVSKKSISVISGAVCEGSEFEKYFEVKSVSIL